MEQTEEDLKSHIAKKIKEAEFTIQSESDEKAREILVDAMQKSATDYVAEATATTIDIESEELKGKIIVKDLRVLILLLMKLPTRLHFHVLIQSAERLQRLHFKNFLRMDVFTPAVLKKQCVILKTISPEKLNVPVKRWLMMLVFLICLLRS